MALPKIVKDIEERIIRPGSTDNAIVRFNGTGGQVQNSSSIIDDTGVLDVKRDTGSFRKIYDNASTIPALAVGSNNQDIDIIKVWSSDATQAQKGVYGYSLRYRGTGSGRTNFLTLYADNSNATSQVIGWTVDQSGQVGIKTDAVDGYALYVNGATRTGTATISTTSFGAAIIERSGTTNGASIQFKNSNGSLGYVGMTGSANGGLQRWSADSNTAYKILDSGNYTSYVVPITGGTYTGKIKLAGSLYSYHTDSTSYALDCSNSDVIGVNGIYFADACDSMTEGIHFYRSASAWDTIAANAGTFYFAANHGSSQALVGNATIKAGAVYGAVWNDYAEYRDQAETIEPGYCVTSFNNGKISKTTEKYQACDGIVSDTFGFAIGETDDCKTPLAVAGRVLAYCHGNKYEYQAGDTVCAGPDGKVMKMTREEIKEYPDRIIGHVSEIPEYETWGEGNVKVNGRIWIRIK